MERKNKPSSIPVSPSLPQPSVSVNNNEVDARLPSGDAVKINLYGATVTSWKTANGTEQLFLSTAAALDGSKPIRGGIPLVFPCFGPPPKDHATSQLPQHGLARNSYWNFMGKSSSESLGKKSDDSVKLDFTLTNDSVADAMKGKWAPKFALLYSVTLGRGRLECTLTVTNEDNAAFEFQTLFHTYLAVQDITKTTVQGLQSSQYIDKVRGAKSFEEPSASLSFSGETDRVYTPKTQEAGQHTPLEIKENGRTRFTMTRDSLQNVTVWNGWEEKIKGMGDFEPKDGWRRYLCIEPGSVDKWVKLEAGDAWSGGAEYICKL